MSANDAQRAEAAPYAPFDTTEVRWFADGALPDSLAEWFTKSGRWTELEIRRDAYLVDRSPDVGRKQRDQGPFEVKTRRGRSGVLHLPGGLRGHLEEWRKHIAGAQPPPTPDERWSDVHKVVLTRIYQHDPDDQVAEIETRNPLVAGCAIELASVAVSDVRAWTFALEAWGPDDRRRSLLEQAAALFVRTSEFPPGFTSRLTADMGYPEWLSSVVWDLPTPPPQIN